MLCFIYRSNKKQYAYLYLAKRDDFDCLPHGMLEIFGQPEFSMTLNLTADKKLAQEDVQQVREKLENEGYFLQLPKNDYDIAALEEKLIQSMQDKNA